MGFGIYSCMNGAKSKAQELEILANNIANVQTVGYKEMGMAFHSTLDKEIKTGNDEVPNVAFDSKDRINFTDGSIYKTDNPLDLALQGDGFFEVQTKDGVRYTRNGHFSIDKDSRLITQNGDVVLSSNGPVTLPTGKTIAISNSGEITAGTDQIGKLKVVTFDDKSKLTLQGMNFYKAEEGVPSKDSSSFTVAQGFLEGANVSLIRNLTRIVEVSRAYETCQKSMTQQFEITQTLNQIARG
jgi:flagellar basal-body rod protein FlgF